MDAAFSAYLQALADHLGYADAADAVGYNRRSFNSIKALYGLYGVNPPERRNQHSVVSETPVKHPLTSSQSILGASQRQRVDVERLAVLSDIHFPNHDPRALAVALALVEDIQPEKIVLGGDVADVYALSRWSKDPQLELYLQEEIDQVVEFLVTLRRTAPGAEIIWVEGNHELRLREWVKTNARGLYKLRNLSIEALFGLDELNIQYVKGSARTAYYEYGPIRIGHFDRINQQSAYTAKLLVDKYAESVVQGHTHRGGVHYRTYPSGKTVVGVESFCLCDTNPEYCERPNWQQGLIVITKRRGADRFHVQPVPIVGYEALYNDVLYSA